MSRSDELRLMTKVARLYYERGLTQPEIALRLEISQATISRLLKRALQEKIVRISVSVPFGAYPELEEGLQNIYGLREAIVVDSVEDDEQILRDIGAAGAFYLETTVKPGEIIGISSWSATILAMVEAMHPLSRPTNTRVVQILGGVGNPAAEVHAAHLTARLAQLVRGDASFLPAPGVAGSAEVVPIFLADRYVAEAVELFDHVTLAIVGIGTVEPSGLLASSGNIFSAHELELLRQKGAEGDICLRFFDRNGDLVDTPLNNRVIGMNLAQLRRVKRAVGMAGGKRKTEAIRGALKGRWINVLITDRFTAERLLQTPAEAPKHISVDGASTGEPQNGKSKGYHV